MNYINRLKKPKTKKSDHVWEFYCSLGWTPNSLFKYFRIWEMIICTFLNVETSFENYERLLIFISDDGTNISRAMFSHQLVILNTISHYRLLVNQVTLLLVS